VGGVPPCYGLGLQGGRTLNWVPVYQVFLASFYVLGPAWVFFLYPVFSKWGRLASPWLVLPGAAAVATALFWLTGYLHYAPFVLFFSGLYLYLLKGLKMKAPDSFAVAAMATFASDQLWQLPLYFHTWTQSAYLAEIGLATAGFSLMSVPFALFFVWKAGGGLSLGDTAKGIVLLLAIDDVVEAATFGSSFPTLYWQMPMWVAFFGFVASSSLGDQVHKVALAALDEPGPGLQVYPAAGAVPYGDAPCDDRLEVRVEAHGFEPPDTMMSGPNS